MKYNLTPRENSSPIHEKETGEVLNAVQKLIVRLRSVFYASNLSVADVSRMINNAVSPSTLYRFFEDGSELTYNFDFQYTVLPIMNALLVEDTLLSGDNIAAAKVSGFETMLQIREEQISALRAELEAQRAAFEHRCEDYDSRLKLWHEQIRQKDAQLQKKDERLDRKDGIIADQSKEIHELRARIDELIAHHDQDVHELRALIDDLSAKLTENEVP